MPFSCLFHLEKQTFLSPLRSVLLLCAEFSPRIPKFTLCIFSTGWSLGHMTRQRLYHTKEIIPRRPWKSKNPFASRHTNMQKRRDARGGRGTTRYFLRSYRSPTARFFQDFPFFLGQDFPFFLGDFPDWFFSSFSTFKVFSSKRGLFFTVKGLARSPNSTHTPPPPSPPPLLVDPLLGFWPGGGGPFGIWGAREAPLP